MSVLSELSPIEYEGLTYSSINHAYYASITKEIDIKWYLVNSESEKEVDIVKSNFSFTFMTDEKMKKAILNKIIAIRDRDPVFNSRIRKESDMPVEITEYLDTLL